MKPKNARRVYLIEKEMQFAYAKEVFISLFVFAVVLTVLMFLPSIIELTKPITGDPRQTASAHEFLSISARLWPSLLATAIVLALLSVYRSHRFAGPIYRFKKTTEILGEGRVDYRIKLRKKDFLKDFQNIYNGTLGTFDDKLTRIKRLNAEIIEYASKDGPIESDRIRELSKELGMTLAFFTTTGEGMNEKKP